MPKLLVVSNGRGEDYIAARVSERLRDEAPEISVQAFPLVGTGEQLSEAGIEVVGPRRAMPSGGFTMHSPEVLLRDLRAGLLGLTRQQASFLRGRTPTAVFVVGDVYAHAHAALVKAPRRVLQTLVSAHHAGGGTSALRYFMESFRAPELWLMRRADKVYARDAATAELLRKRSVNAAHLGNPMMDGLDAGPLVTREEAGPPVVALLPGSRGQAHASFDLMRRALEMAPPVLGLVAWAGDRLPDRPDGWESVGDGGPRVAAAWRRGDRRIWLVKGAFPAVLKAAEVVIGTAGTANEQAVGLCLPVVAYPVPPFYGEAYMRNQKRLLEGALLTVEPAPRRVADMLALALRDERVRARARRAGEERMGGPGASAALAQELAEWVVEAG